MTVLNINDSVFQRALSRQYSVSECKMTIYDSKIKGEKRHNYIKKEDYSCCSGKCVLKAKRKIAMKILTSGKGKHYTSRENVKE